MPTRPAAETPSRRRPVQARARETRELIFEAALRILEADGLKGFNTNRIAEVSGFSVGTLYQYFADKQAILDALGEREFHRTAHNLKRAMLANQAGPGKGNAAERVRETVRVLLGAFGGRHRARKVLIDSALATGKGERLESPVRSLAELLSSGELAVPGSAPLAFSTTQSFVITQAVVGAIRAALARDPQMLKTAAFEDALVRLIVGFLNARKG